MDEVQHKAQTFTYNERAKRPSSYAKKPLALVLVISRGYLVFRYFHGKDLSHNFPTHRQPRHQIPYTQLPPLSSLLSPRLTVPRRRERETPKVFKKKYLRPSPDARSYAQCRNNPSDNLFALFSKPCYFMCQDNTTLASPGYPFSSTSTYSSYSPASFSSLPTLRRHRRHSMLS